MTRQQASERNNLKRRLIGSVIDARHPALSEDERDIIKEINDNVSRLISKWDDTSEMLGFNIRPHKCILCGIRSIKAYIHLMPDGPKNFCSKHYKEITK